MKISGIYKICSKSLNNRFYIGSSYDLNKRQKNHIYCLTKKNHPNYPLQNHVNEYGIDDIYFVVLESGIEKSNLKIREQYYLDNLKPFFNLCKKANSQIGVKRTEEFKKKCSERMKLSFINWTGAFKNKNKKPNKNYKTKKNYINQSIINNEGLIFKTIKLAAEYYGVKPKTLSAQLTGQNKNKFNLRKI